jgi:signal transduction histidine kinase
MDHKVVIEIEDSGAGIPMTLKEKIFEPFFTTKKIGEGTGLGLKIVQDFVENHHGTLDFESEPGRTVFRVTLRKGNVSFLQPTS